MIETKRLVNLGKWVLRYLFAALIDEEIKRDESYRRQIQNTQHSSSHKGNSLHLGELPKNPMPGWPSQEDFDSAITPRPTNGFHATTPGLSIAIATPGLSTINNAAGAAQNAHPSTVEENELKKIQTNTSPSTGDYFSNPPPPIPPQPSSSKSADGSSDSQPDAPQSPTEPEKDAKSSSLFGKKFRMNFPKKLGRPSTEAKPTIVDDKSEESDKSSEKEDRVVEDNFYGIIQKIRNDYDDALAIQPDEPLQPGITPSLPSETPVLKPPAFTTIIIQEDSMDSGGLADLYRGTVRCVGQDADLIEKAAPMWLGDLLLRVIHPPLLLLPSTVLLLVLCQANLHSPPEPNPN